MASAMRGSQQPQSVGKTTMITTSAVPPTSQSGEPWMVCSVCWEERGDMGDGVSGSLLGLSSSKLQKTSSMMREPKSSKKHFCRHSPLNKALKKAVERALFSQQGLAFIRWKLPEIVQSTKAPFQIREKNTCDHETSGSWERCALPASASRRYGRTHGSDVDGPVANAALCFSACRAKRCDLATGRKQRHGMGASRCNGSQSRNRSTSHRRLEPFLCSRRCVIECIASNPRKWPGRHDHR